VSDDDLPPGNSGLPFIGELPALQRDPFGFVEQRAATHGAVFRTKILGRDTAVLNGPEGAGVFADGEQVQRAGGMPGFVERLFGGPGVLPLLDGEEHRARKRFVMTAFTPEALADHEPRLRAVVAEHLARWAGAGEMRWVPALRRLALEVICRVIVGLEPGDTLETVAADYDRVLAGFASLPIPLPGTGYWRATRALDRILGVYREQIARAPAALARLLAARGSFDDEVIAAELHHMVMAGVIVWEWMVTAVVELDRHPQLRDGAAADAAALDRFVDEVRRLSPVTPAFFGVARRPLTIGGRRVPRGWGVMWGPRPGHLMPDIYPDPLRFDPDRFKPGRAEHQKCEHAFVPNGAGDAHTGHKCAGYEFAPMVLRVFLRELLGGYRWSFPQPQDFTLVPGTIPPEPRDRLRVLVSRRG
jgi:cytochrome P450